MAQDSLVHFRDSSSAFNNISVSKCIIFRFLFAPSFWGFSIAADRGFVFNRCQVLADGWRKDLNQLAGGFPVLFQFERGWHSVPVATRTFRNIKRTEQNNANVLHEVNKICISPKVEPCVCNCHCHLEHQARQRGRPNVKICLHFQKVSNTVF
jgi:hypothetical protein